MLLEQITPSLTRSISRVSVGQTSRLITIVVRLKSSGTILSMSNVLTETTKNPRICWILLTCSNTSLESLNICLDWESSLSTKRKTYRSYSGNWSSSLLEERIRRTLPETTTKRCMYGPVLTCRPSLVSRVKLKFLKSLTAFLR